MYSTFQPATGHGNFDAVLAAYPASCQPRQVEKLVRGGLSGAEIFRLATAAGPLCLRCWPKEHPQREQLLFIHAVQRFVWHAGFHKIPVPLDTRAGCSFVAHNGHFWELAPWLPGESNWRAQPALARLESALQALAQFHGAAAGFPNAGPKLDFSPGIKSRRDLMNATGGPPRFASQAPLAEWPEFENLIPRFCQAYRAVRPKLEKILEAAARMEVTRQPCLRDVWHENVLFSGPEVTGLVDFGALRYESVAADVARLLGSLALDDPSAWKAGLAAYASVRPLSANELALVHAFDRSFVALAGWQWFEWILVDKRQFPQRATVLTRLSEILSRLECWARGEEVLPDFRTASL